MTARALLLLHLVAALAFAGAGCAGGGGTSAEGGAVATTRGAPTADGGFGRIPEIVEEVQPQVVTLLVGTGVGSGVIWSTDGLIVTNDHVVGTADEVEVVFASGERVPGRVRARDAVTDLAVVEVRRRGLPRATFSTALPRVGELAVAVGSPLGLSETVTAGIVSGLHRTIPGQATASLVDLIQTDAAISPGNSGGALVDARGDVIGINVAFVPPEARAVSIGFAIPGATVVDVVRELIENGRAEHAFLGIQPAAVTPALAERFDLDADEGVLVLDVVAGSAADRGGLRPGDILVRLDGRPIRTVDDLFTALRAHDPGDRVTLRVVRDGRTRSASVTLTARPER